MGEVQDASPVRQLLERESLAAIAEPVEIVVADQRHVARLGRALCGQRRTGQCEAHDQKRDVKGSAHGAYSSSGFHVPGSTFAQLRTSERRRPNLHPEHGTWNMELLIYFDMTTTVSMCGVWGNMSTGCIDSIAYPCRTISCRSRASVSGLQET